MGDENYKKSTKLISISQPAGELSHLTPEELIIYCARVSNPKNQNNLKTASKLIKYCIDNQHWSIFEQINMCIEIVTSRAISAQILRHRSFTFQEFSQRYAEVPHIKMYNARRQDDKNRQNSIDDMSEEDKAWFLTAQIKLQSESKHLYQEALNRGIAKEQARFLLPMASESKLYMNGTVRSWIHYLTLRCANGTQQEHINIAEDIKKIFCEQLPIIAEALEWT